MKSDNSLYAEGFPFKFPAGETQVRVDTSQDYNLEGFDWPVKTIFKRVHNGDDIMEILLTADALRRAGHKRLKLILPYVPYSRQDRVMVEGESLGIKVFTDLINSVGFETVEIYDPHSDVTPSLINNVRVIPQEILVRSVVPHQILESCILVCPDAGARKKIQKVAQSLNRKVEIVYADKIRDAATGKITGTTLNFEGTSISGAQDIPYEFLIVDDICEGGYTFTEIAKAMEMNLTGIKYNLNLYITHGFFSKGLEELNKYFIGIFCANLMKKEIK